MASNLSVQSQAEMAFQRMYTPQIHRAPDKEPESVTRRYFQTVSRVAGASGPAVHGLIFELADGTRFGNLLGRDRAEMLLSDDDDLAMRNAWWERLDDYERIVAVKGHYYSEKFLAYDVSLVTSEGRTIRFGGPQPPDPFYHSLKGRPFHFRADQGGEVEQVLFEAGRCLGIRGTQAQAQTKGDDQRETLISAMEEKAAGRAWELGVVRGLLSGSAHTGKPPFPTG